MAPWYVLENMHFVRRLFLRMALEPYLCASSSLVPWLMLPTVLPMCAGAVELLQKGSLPPDHWDWAWGADFRFAKDGDAGEDTGDHASTSGSKPGNRQAPLLTMKSLLCCANAPPLVGCGMSHRPFQRSLSGCCAIASPCSISAR